MVAQRECSRENVDNRMLNLTELHIANPMTPGVQVLIRKYGRESWKRFVEFGCVNMCVGFSEFEENLCVESIAEH